MKLKKLIVAVFCILTLATSCTLPKDIAYMQNATIGKDDIWVNMDEIKVQPLDQISIIVSCKEPELAQLFNLVQPSNRLGQVTSKVASSSGYVSVYTISKDGNIQFPVLGEIHVAGLTRQEICNKIATALKNGKWVSDPTVTVEFANLQISVLGQVARPGNYPINNDRMNLLQAISLAGDLTINGKRNIMVIREENGVRTKYMVDLTDEKLFQSPVYNLKQNDIIYVAPNQTLARQASDDPNNWKSLSFWMSIVTFISTMTLLIVK